MGTAEGYRARAASSPAARAHLALQRQRLPEGHVLLADARHHAQPLGPRPAGRGLGLVELEAVDGLEALGHVDHHLGEGK
jgi:hypothetical protein